MQPFLWVWRKNQRGGLTECLNKLLKGHIFGKLRISFEKFGQFWKFEALLEFEILAKYHPFIHLHDGAFLPDLFKCGVFPQCITYFAIVFENYPQVFEMNFITPILLLFLHLLLILLPFLFLLFLFFYFLFTFLLFLFLLFFDLIFVFGILLIIFFNCLLFRHFLDFFFLFNKFLFWGLIIFGSVSDGVSLVGGFSWTH